MNDKTRFTCSDIVAGYVTTPVESSAFRLKTTDDREYEIRLTDSTYAEVLRNLGEYYHDPGMALLDLIKPGRYLFVYSLIYPEQNDWIFEAKHIVAVGYGENEYRFEEQDWWIKQIRALAEFYFHAQFPDGVIDYTKYRTHLTLEGQRIEQSRQETDTISRMVYGFATAYLLTGENRYLEAAEKGTDYLHQHMRAVDEREDVVYWYHAIDRHDGREQKILASQFSDDYQAIPAYEQIYALAGPIQTYRVTGNPSILADAEKTIHLFNRFFLDRERGGFFSHIDPVTLDPRAELLGQDRARKNWNSIGDHAPAYLINLWLATGKEEYAQFLTTTADLIVEHFPDDEHSPFVQERFYEDWSRDTSWGWQQNRAVVGHNLKIAWNLMRISHMHPDERYVTLARKIGNIMPTIGMDQQRGGWYDVMERERKEGQEWQRFTWHDRKAWWQQEQGILAYLILHGSLKEPEYLRMARESQSFYNAFFPDHDNGGVYFNVLANGIPYLVGTERLKGSHSMSGYHSFELCYLAAVYTNLLILKQPMDLYFKPIQGAFKDNLLRVQPDILPPGSVYLEKVWIDGMQHQDFDSVAMTVKLPTPRSKHPLELRPGWLDKADPTQSFERRSEVRVRIVPAGLQFDVIQDIVDGVAHLTLYGILNDTAEPLFKAQIDKLVALQPHKLVLHLEDLQMISRQSARVLSFTTEQLTLEEEIVVVGVRPQVRKVLQNVGVWEEFRVLEAASVSGANEPFLGI
ncbi:MAG TPA: AGE family epimerase/isomerase [Ktedonosporobacter sp.]|nr:AGE family epimerase/isomerase [Ktedonosporobacter sp.]